MPLSEGDIVMYVGNSTGEFQDTMRIGKIGKVISLRQDMATVAWIDALGPARVKEMGTFGVYIHNLKRLGEGE